MKAQRRQRLSGPCISQTKMNSSSKFEYQYFPESHGKYQDRRYADYLFAFGTSSRVGEPDFSLTCCCPLSLYPTSLMQISTAGRGGKCLDCIQAFPASTLPFSLALTGAFVVSSRMLLFTRRCAPLCFALYV